MRPANGLTLPLMNEWISDPKIRTVLSTGKRPVGKSVGPVTIAGAAAGPVWQPAIGDACRGLPVCVGPLPGLGVVTQLGECLLKSRRQRARGALVNRCDRSRRISMYGLNPAAYQAGYSAAVLSICLFVYLP